MWVSAGGWLSRSAELVRVHRLYYPTTIRKSRRSSLLSSITLTGSPLVHEPSSLWLLSSTSPHHEPRLATENGQELVGTHIALKLRSLVFRQLALCILGG
jgi:hypothetical protein